MNRVLRTVTSLALATVAGTAGVLVAAGPAQASDAVGGPVVTRALAADEALDRAKAEVTRRIDLRLAALRRYGAAVNNARHLTDAHEATLDALIAEDAAGLTALRRKVAGETTLAALRADAASMVNDYRIFILVRPKVRLTIAGDAEQAVIRRLSAAHGTLTDLVARAKAAGKDTAGAEQDLADMQAALDRAEAPSPARSRLCWPSSRGRTATRSRRRSPRCGGRSARVGRICGRPWPRRMPYGGS